MKRAGLKNDGAWFRANKFIKSLSEDDRSMLGNIIQNLPTIDAAFNALVSLQSEVGLSAESGWPDSAGAWGISMALKGIPRQIWYGHLTFTTYALSGEEGSRKATANYQSPIHYFAKDLRRAVSVFKAADRELRDVFDILGRNNPSGLPNATKPPKGTFE